MTKPSDEDEYLDSLTRYKSVKVSLKSIIRYSDNIDDIKRIANTINKIDIHTYHMIKLYCLYKFETEGKIPDIDENLIMLIMKTVSTSNNNRGTFKEKNQDLKDDLEDFYDNFYDGTIYEAHKPLQRKPLSRLHI